MLSRGEHEMPNEIYVKFSLVRDVTRLECDWLERDYLLGESVYKETGVSYGAVSYGGIAVTDKPGKMQFFELPRAALKIIEEDQLLQVEELTISEMSKLAYENARDKGFHDGDCANRTVGDEVALMHTELSEAFDAFRKNGLVVWKDGDKPEGFIYELADVLIRIGDTCESRASELVVDLETAVKEKMAYNKTRSYRHGGKRL